MVDFKLLASEYKYCSESERRDRDRVAIDMAKTICTRYFNGDLSNSLYLVVSFFSTLVYCEFMEYLEVAGIKALCRVDTGVDRVIRITLEPKDTPLWSKQM